MMTVVICFQRKGGFMQLLHIDSSVLGSNSVSRALSAEIVARQAALRQGLKVVRRDLAADKALHLSAEHLAAWQGGSVNDASLGADLAKGSAYLDELFAADLIVIGTPMHNFSIPSQLKAWIDRVVVAGKTFRYGPNGPGGTRIYRIVGCDDSAGGGNCARLGTKRCGHDGGTREHRRHGRLTIGVRVKTRFRPPHLVS